MAGVAAAPLASALAASPRPRMPKRRDAARDREAADGREPDRAGDPRAALLLAGIGVVLKITPENDATPLR
jgi:hypothetical protein